MNYDVTVYDNLEISNSDIKLGFLETVSEDLSFTNTVNAGAKMKETLTENLAFTNTAVASKLISVIVEENIDYTNSFMTNAQYLATLTEKLEINAFVTSYKDANGDGNLELDDNLDCWVVNYENDAFSRYNNFDFNSFAKLGDSYYAVNSLGLYKLEGNKDDDKDISSKILTGKIDISGMGSLSYVRDIILYHKSDGTLRMNIKASDGRTETYRLMQPSDELVSTRFKNLSGKRKAVYWQFELTNDEQTTFDLKEMKIYRVITGRVS